MRNAKDYKSFTTVSGHDFNKYLVAPKRAVLFSRYLSLQLNVVSSRLSWVEALLGCWEERHPVLWRKAWALYSYSPVCTMLCLLSISIVIGHF